LFAPAVRKAALRPTRFHDLRRSFVAQCVTAGIPVAQTAAWLGHTLRMTTLYYQVSQPEVLAALELLDRVG
jgi:integrase